jgi:hypothetical protein
MSNMPLIRVQIVERKKIHVNFLVWLLKLKHYLFEVEKYLFKFQKYLKALLARQINSTSYK